MGLFDLFSSNNEKKAAKAQKAGLNAGRDAAYGELDKGLGAYNQYAGQAQGYYQPYADTSLKANSSYADALGLNGADGNARTTAAFQAGPGYEFAMDQGLQQLERRASARGALGGGGLTADSIGYAQGLANQEYGNYLDRLQGLQTQGVGIAGNQAGIATGQGAAAYDTYGNRANIGWQAETGKGQADAQYQMSKDQTGANIFNAITGGLSLGGKLLGIGGYAPGGR
jgi:hypothetical protein